jgi:hypothetical protein
MKTTIELPDALVIAAKKRAAELRKPLRALVEAGLRAELARKPVLTGGKRLKLAQSRGRLPKDLDVSSRSAMWKWIDEHR